MENLLKSTFGSILSTSLHYAYHKMLVMLFVLYTRRNEKHYKKSQKILETYPKFPDFLQGVTAALQKLFQFVQGPVQDHPYIISGNALQLGNFLVADAGKVFQ